MSGDWSQQADGGSAPLGWELLAQAVADRYRIHLDGADPRRKIRYIAVARSLDVRPYAVVTSDPAELLTALGSDPRLAAAHGEETRQ
jgi:hypothetical protein